MRATDLYLAFAAVLVVLAGTAMVQGERAPAKDELGFLEVAHDLNERGTFTDGSYAPPGTRGRPGRFLAPAYPGLVHLLSRLDPGLREAVACHVGSPKSTRAECGGRFTLLILVQAALIAAGAAALFATALMLTRSRAVAALALALALAMGELGAFPRLMLSESIAIPAFLGFLACAVAWAEGRGGPGVAIAAGALLALAALTRPSYLYLFYAVAAGLAAFAVWRGGARRELSIAAAFIAAGALVLIPWMARNYVQLGDPALTSGYAAFTLSQRIAYNAMTWREWLIAWVYWLPDFGDNLVKGLLPKSDWVRLGWTDPSSFYLTGVGKVYSDTLSAAGSIEAHLGHLLREHVLGDLVKHVAVTLPLTMRGIWAGGYLALAGVLLAPLAVRHFKAEGRLAPLLALAAPLFFMAGLHGFVSVNIVRYNEAMIALWAVIVAWGLAMTVPWALAKRARSEK